jgi:predicted Zn-dependent protease
LLTRTKSALRQKFFVFFLVAIAALVVAIIHDTSKANTKLTEIAQASKLPQLQQHPLPASLAHWQDQSNSGDYFSEIKPTEVGYLVWSQLPVKVYIQQPHAETHNAERLQSWANEVLQAIQEWNVYFPLQVVERPEVADIKILRLSPPLRIAPNEKFPRARSAETTYELYVSSNRVLAHRCSILLSPNQTGQYLQAAARHEFGHALGIWGHSPNPNDALYFSQVRNPPPISARDVNTLKRVYQQPTRLGWLLPRT